MMTENTGEFVFYSDKLNYKTVVGAKGKEFFIEGYISTGDLDLVNDIVTKSCMDSMLSQFDQRSIKLDFEHETFRGKSKLEAEANKTRLPLGRAISKDQDSKGVKVKWKMNENWKKFDEKGNVVMTFKDIWSNVENEMLDAFSIAYVPTSTKSVSREGKDVRMLDNVNLLNVALTGNPINPHATMSAVMAKSLAFMKDQEVNDMDTIEIKNKEKKSFSEDGKHVHTEEKPMGEHNHPEIEKAIEDLWTFAYKLSNRVYEVEDVSESPETALKNNYSGEKLMTEKKDDPETAGVASATNATEGKKNDAPADDATVSTEEKSVDVKALAIAVEKLTTEVKDLKEENVALKAIVEKPLQKAKGAENNETKSQNVPENKSLGPIDRIR